MDKTTAARIGIDVLKFVGNIVKDTIDVGDYRITIMLERKIDERQGIVIDSVSVDKKMSALQAEVMMKELKKLVDKDEK